MEMFSVFLAVGPSLIPSPGVTFQVSGLNLMEFAKIIVHLMQKDHL